MSNDDKIEAIAEDDVSESESESSEEEDYLGCDCVDANDSKRKVIPYTSVYEDTSKARQRGYFIPGVPIKAKIVNAERDATGAIHLFNPYVYTIELEHGPYKWTIRRRYTEFNHLHNRLLIYRAAQKMKAPVRRYREWHSHRRLERTLRYREGDLTARSGDTDTPRSVGVDQVDRATNTGDGEQKDAVNGNAKIESPRTDRAGDDSDEEVHEHTHHGKKCTRACRLPKFPLWPDSIVPEENLDERRSTLEKYIQAVLHIPAYRNHHETAEFLQTCRYSFVNNLGGKCREGLVKKRPGGRRVFVGWKRWCVEHCAKWSKKWLIIKDSCLVYIEPDSEQIKAVILFDGDFHVQAGAAETEGVRHGLLICNLQRLLLLKTLSDRLAEEWRQSIENVVMRGAGQIWLENHRFGSSFPVREHSYAQWFVDGGPFMRHAADMLELAQEEIFITDWWLSPEIYMKRPMTEGNRWSLDELLKRKANLGVKIFVLLYKEVEMALGINSMYTKHKLQGLHENIKVIRHPDHVPGSGTYLWAHHEKLICIDQNIAFVGGIDLCYGRWDDHKHRLTDEGSVHYHTQHSIQAGQHTMMTGMRTLAANVPSALPIQQVEESEPENVELDREVAEITIDGATEKNDNEQKKPTVEFADIEAKASAQTVEEDKKSAEPPKRHLTFRSLAAKVKPKRSNSEQHRTGAKDKDDPYKTWSAALEKFDLAEVVTQYKKMVDSGKMEQIKRRGDTPPPTKKSQQVLNKWRASRLRRRWRRTLSDDDKDFGKGYELSWLKLQAANDEVDTGLEGRSKWWIGKDYVNFIFKDFTDLDMPFHDFIDRGVTPRMPWHDIHSVAYGAAARDVARHFIQRWNVNKTEKMKADKSYPFLVPKSYENVQVPKMFRNIKGTVKCQVQMLRSSASWSAGMNAVEDSIQSAYLHMIANAQHYVYIENQFFVTIINSPDIKNEICKVLADRIERAQKAGEQFRVYVMLPLMPGFEGQIGATGGSALQAVLHWTYLSISRGSHSLYGELHRREVTEPEKYVFFSSLRTHSTLGNKLITELIYIHSKLIIVDDRCALIGSANINDRSMMGKRDSEVALYFEDFEFEPSRMNGQHYMAGKFAGSLRRRLFREHLGLLDDDESPRSTPEIDVTDPVCDQFFFDVWTKIAKSNMQIFENVFRCIPTDEVKSFEEHVQYTAQIPMAEYMKVQAQDELKKIQGNLVMFPKDFLCNSDLSPSITTKEGLAPTSLFT